MDRRDRVRLYLENSPTKRRLLTAVREKPRSLSDLARELDLTHSTVTQHVEELVALSLVTREAVGRRVFVSLTDLGQSLAS